MEGGGALMRPSPRERIGDQCLQQQKQLDCRHFLQTGTCAYGRSCKFNHPVTGQAVFPSLGAFTSAERPRWEQQQQHQHQVLQQQPAQAQHPERPGQPECPHYVKTGTCKFFMTCKFHHSPRLAKPSAAAVAPSTAVLLAAQSQAQRVGGVLLNAARYPYRPGQKDCDYYLKTGQCKFGVSCKFNHPDLIAAAASNRPQVFPLPPKPSVPIPVPTPTISAGYQPPPVGLVRSGAAPPIPVSPVVYPVPVGVTRLPPPPFTTQQPPQSVPSAPGHVQCFVQHPGGIVYLPPGWNYQYVWPAATDHSHLLPRPHSQQVNSPAQSHQQPQQQQSQPMSGGGTMAGGSIPATDAGGSYFFPPRSHLAPPPPPPPPTAVTNCTVPAHGSDSLQAGGLGGGRGGGGGVIPLAGTVVPFGPSSNPGLLTGNTNVNVGSRSTGIPASLPGLAMTSSYPPGMIGVQGIMAPSHNGSVGCTGVMLFPQTLAQSSSAGPFPERPGQLECRYYVRTGTCRYGMSCRFHHPKDRKAAAMMGSGGGSGGISGGGVGVTARCALNPMGFPLRPGQPPCAFYVRNGNCKFGVSCKFDHPGGELEYCPSASSIVDMPVAPLPERSSAAAAAEEENEVGEVTSSLHKPKEGKEGKEGQSNGGGSEVNRPADGEGGRDNDDDDDDDDDGEDAEEVRSSPIQAIVVENSGLVSVGSQ